MADRPQLPTGRGRIATTEDTLDQLAARVFDLERALAAALARIATLEAAP